MDKPQTTQDDLQYVRGCRVAYRVALNWMTTLHPDKAIQKVQHQIEIEDGIIRKLLNE